MNGKGITEMRLTFVVNWKIDKGGVGRVFSNMANFWAKKGWEITIVNLLNETGPSHYSLDPKIVHRPINFYLKSSNPFQRLFSIFKRHLILRRAIQETKPDCVISFDRYQNFRTIISTLGLGIPVIATEHRAPNFYPETNRVAPFLWWLYSLATPVLLTSDAFSYFPKWIRKHCRVIPNACAVTASNKKNVVHDDSNRNGKVLIAMGRLVEQKRFDLLLNAFGNVAPKYPDWTLVVWGEGELRPSLEKLRDQLGLQERVRFPGWNQQPYKELEKADLFVLSSMWEAFPMTLVESMACGLPVISFDCRTGPRDIIRDGVDGILVPPEDVPALSKAMDRLMGDKLERNRLAERAPEVAERFSTEKIMGVWEELIQELTGKKLIRQN